MVLLTITPTIVSALAFRANSPDASPLPNDPPLDDPTLGEPISHVQLIALAHTLRTHSSCYHLDDLLRGSKVYVPPPPPKPEPTPEYKALMAHLRCMEEAEQYAKMTSSTPAPSSLNPNPTPSSDMEYITRATSLILNILLSIVACSVSLWLVSKSWSTAARLALAMAGSIIVAAAEVVVYAGYLRRIDEAKKVESKTKEVKELVGTWIIKGKADEKEEAISVDSKEEDTSVRRRNIKV